MKLNLHLRSSHILHPTNLQFALLNSLGNRLLKCVSRLSKRYLTDDKRPIVEFLNLRTYFQYASSLSIIILRNINATPCWEVRIEMELLATQVVNGSIADVVKIMWKYLG